MPLRLHSSAGPYLLRRSSTTDSTIPKQLQDAVPACALTCLSDWVDNEYTEACRDSSCLCNRYANDSYTLGEMALICAKSGNCAETVDDQTAIDAYNVCSKSPNAVPGLHTVLTTTVYGTTPSSTSTAPLRTSSPTSQTASRTLTSWHAASSTSARAASTPASAATSTPAAKPSDTATSKSTLTSGQAVGISIGVVSGVAIVVSIVYLLSCIRRRKASRERKSRLSYDLVHKGSNRYWPFLHDSEGVHQSIFNDHFPAHTELPYEKHDTVWPSQHHRLHEQRGEQMTEWSESRRNTSTRTVSQLLPEPPGTTPPPPATTYSQSVSTPATLFEGEHTSILPRVRVPGLPAHPAVLKTRQTRSHGLAQPALAVVIPEQHLRAPYACEFGSWPLLPPPPPVHMADEDRCSSQSGTLSSKISLLDYYASSDSGASPQAIFVSPAPCFPETARDSVGSEASRRTSFESNLPDELTPPEEDDKRLSAVAESPISHIRYPRIPRSSNQAVPRSPMYSGYPATASSKTVTPGCQQMRNHRPSLSSSTLAAKRRGETAANDLQKSIYISNSAYCSRPRNYIETVKNAQHSRTACAQ